MLYLCRVLPDAPRVDVDSPPRERSRSRERSRERHKLKRRRYNSDSDSDTSHSSAERSSKHRHSKRREPKRKVLKPNSSDIPRSSRAGERYATRRRSHGSYWLHDDRDYDDYKKGNSSDKQDSKSMQKKLSKKPSTEQKTSNREVLLPSKLQEKKEYQNGRVQGQSPPVAENKEVEASEKSEEKVEQTKS